ncbi:hypothetical protein GCM10007148_24780 [Parvularcula lutaonensis]|nr:hypothetical protein GCM10007148_24780 [Parvularcula lutaonensis]
MAWVSGAMEAGSKTFGSMMSMEEVCPDARRVGTLANRQALITVMTGATAAEVRLCVTCQSGEDAKIQQAAFDRRGSKDGQLR